MREIGLENEHIYIFEEKNIRETELDPLSTVFEYLCYRTLCFVLTNLCHPFFVFHPNFERLSKDFFTFMRFAANAYESLQQYWLQHHYCTVRLATVLPQNYSSVFLVYILQVQDLAKYFFFSK